MKLNIAVSSTIITREDEAKILAAKLNLDWLPDPKGKTASNYDYLLLFTPGYLCLQKTNDKKFKPFYVDFLSGKIHYRSKQASLRKELLARAIGIKPSEHPSIIDATAGLGRDSFILAKLGYNVTMLERSPILYAMLRDGLMRGLQDKKTAAICTNLTLIHTDAISWLKKLKTKEQPQIIYLDPMFPERKKTASAKKDMAILQELLENEADDEELFSLAFTCATRRVVVKRSRFASTIAKSTPSFSMIGKSSRFDVYLINDTNL